MIAEADGSGVDCVEPAKAVSEFEFLLLTHNRHMRLRKGDGDLQVKGGRRCGRPRLSRKRIAAAEPDIVP